ncbi:polysaccharide pyruvyl transferase family protein [Grimontia hollisae]|uniref:polysaccharide pyruvyl transferase family protein n=1 Tax=Grimontia hollisae TaxID=673 RepID=UPI00165D97E8|nr:polysaccharide pyruvyl transferase family protein [Grimontia hollisae]
MNCSIVTFHRAHNYGAVLQAYALQKVINSLGHNVSFFDYQHEEIAKVYRLIPALGNEKIITYLKRLLNTALDFKRKKARYKAFNQFINSNFKLSDSKRLQHFDVVVLGSDQIWNPEYTNGFVDTHFGRHHNLNSRRIISYAASLGQSNLEGGALKDFSEKLSEIDILGVREDLLKDIILSVSPERDVSVNLDPTLLLDRADWDSISEDRAVSEPYVLVYEVKYNKLTKSAIEYIEKHFGLKVIFLSSRTNYKIPKEYITDASPLQFISLFKHANFVITTSFHGTVFSVINNKPFMTLGFGDHTDVRSKSLLSKIGLSARIVDSPKDFSISKDAINYEPVNDRLMKLRQESMDYLTKCLSE